MKRYAWATTLILLFFAGTAYGQTAYTDAALGLGFGGAVAVGDQEVFVGSAPVGWPRGQEDAGTVYIYQRDAEGTWVEASRLQASDAQFGDSFGRSVFVQGTTLVVGAPGAGAAYVFEKNDAGAWSQIGTLVPSALDDGAEFGGAYERGGFRTGVIAVAGERIAVASFSSATGNGAVHIFGKQGMDWQEEAVLRSDAEDAENFGWSIAAEGEHVVVGAARADGQKGAVYVYGRDASGVWQQQGRLTDADLTGRSRLGNVVAMHDGKVYAGAPGFDRFGSVFVFEKDSETGAWAQAGRISAPAPEEGERQMGGFGMDLAVAGNSLLVGARGGVVAYPMSGSIVDQEAARVLSPPDDRSRGGFGIGMAVRGEVAVIGSPSADYEEGLATVFERGESGDWMPTATLASDVAHFASISGEQVDCEDGMAALFGCDNVDLISFLSASELAANRGVKMTDIWGWEDPVTGKEYVLQARTDGVAFVDISTPQHPVYVGQVMKTAASPGSAWRDVKVYKDHAFIVADGAGAHGMQVFDLTQLRDVDPAAMPVTFDVTAHYTGIHSTHNVVINEDTGFAYAVGNRSGGETCAGQLHMINIQDPANPQFAGCFSHDNAGGTHDSQCVIYRGGDAEHRNKEVCFNSNGSSFIIADVTDKQNPITLAHTTYPNLAYTHQGWLTEDHNYFYMNDELDELSGGVAQTRTLIWDVQDLEDPLLVKEFMLDSKASDHNLYIRGNLMYQSNYQSGLRILDITDPINPVEVGYFDTVPGRDEPGFGGSWSNYPYFKSGIIAVSSRGEGLFLVKKRDVDL